MPNYNSIEGNVLFPTIDSFGLCESCIFPTNKSQANHIAPVPTVPATMTPVAVIRSGRLTLELSNDISESLLCRLLQEVLHA